AVLPQRAAFLNTQLFFDPRDPARANYWHRDPQFHLSLDEQKAALHDTAVVHFRLPLKPERGLQIVPGTHRRWDTDEEFDVRMERNGRKNSDALSTGQTVELAPGDLLVFSANLIHRGLYGRDRLAFDMIFFEANAEPARFAERAALPNADVLAAVDN